ncbi:MAG: S8 family serine peptidase [bacterium]
MGKKIKKIGVPLLVVIVFLFFFAAKFHEWQRQTDRIVIIDQRPAESANTQGFQDPVTVQAITVSSSQDVGLTLPLPGEIQQAVQLEDKPYVDHEVLVQFAPKMSKDAMTRLLNKSGMKLEGVLNKNNLCRVSMTEKLKVEEAVEMLKGMPEVMFSEPNFIIHTTSVPNDPYFSNQWGLHNTGSGTATADADIDAPEAWDQSNGSTSVIVAVVDEGIDLNHPDLSGNIWVNTKEIAGNGIDDDGNGFIDDVNGWDFNHGDATVFDTASEDRHGTEVSGIIGAVGNNGVGTAGVCWHVRIMPVKFIASGSGNVANAVLALNYAVGNGAKVINCSWGGTAYSAALESAFQDVLNAGFLVVTSAGNSGEDTDTKTHYPSNYDFPNIISVTASDKNDSLSYFSNYGQTTVDLAAPGSSIYTTIPDGGYAYFSGTSASTPFVTGAAALALSVDPGLNYSEIKQYILNSVDPISSIATKTVSGGRLNVNNLISSLSSGDSDGDGLPDSFENQYGLNPNDPKDADADPDGDGLTNLQEYEQGTDPKNADTDSDGLSDGFEVTYQLDPKSASDASSDLDGDGLSNLVEYQSGTRPDLVDTDGDGIGDFTEFGPRDSASDSDGDGMIDALDLDSDNDGKTDTAEGINDDDADGIPNYIDMNDTDGPNGDQDGDGITNSVEATFMLYPNLKDSDGDGIDDLTEFGTGPTPRDSDGDGVIDALDQDSDNDGKSDSAEGTGDIDGDGIPNYRDGNDNDGPLGDTDGDGLINQLEALYGMNVNLADSDADGIDDLTEFGPGNTPLDTDNDGIIDALDTDSDGDGSPDKIEGKSDTNSDGVPDRLDNGISTMSTDYGKLSLVLQGGNGVLESVVFLAQPLSEASKPQLDFKYGGVQYKITGLDPGGSITVSIQMPVTLPADTEFWKYNADQGYYPYSAVVSGSTLQFTLTDGANGDDDHLANGTIVDPGYIGIPVVSDQNGAAATPAPAAAGDSGGGGGGGGCSLASNGGHFQGGVTDLIILLFPLCVLLVLRFSVYLMNKKFRYRDIQP